MQELISVIVPVYNVERYLSHCIESILGQTYPHLEIILVNDGSTDSSGEICEEYKRKDKRIKVIHKKNGGLSDARNQGLNLSCGEYVSFIDSDDTIDETYFETLYSLCKKYDADISQVYFKRVYEGGSDKDYFNENICEQCFSNIEMLEEYYNIENGPNVTIACNKLYQKTLFNDIQYPFGKINEDEATTYRLIFLANKIAVSNKKLYYYLQRSNSIMRTNFSEKNLDVLDFIEEKSCFFKNNGLTKLFELNKIYNMKLLIRYCLMAKQSGMDNSIVSNLKNMFINEIDSILKYKSISKSEKTDFSIAKISFGLCQFKQNIFSRIKNGKKKIKLLVKKYIEKKNNTHLLYLRAKSFNLSKYYKCYSEYKNIKNRLGKIHLSKKKAIIFIATPSHGNLGDQAIVYSQYIFFEELGFKDQICEVNEYLYDLYQKKIKRKVQKDDLIVIDGGGNIGTLWMVPENRILNIVMRFSENPILVFPQSAYFIDNVYGKNELHKVERIFNRHPNLHLMLRDKRSYNLMSEYISKNIYLLPDIVLYNKQIKFEDVERKYILTISRKDHEGQSAEQILCMAKTLQSTLKLPIRETDNVIEHNIYPENKRNELFAQFKTISDAKVLITDRLHGMIFAVITNTPCIVFDNINKKISGVYKEWLKDVGNIYMINSMEYIDYEFINSILNTKQVQYDNTKIVKKFDLIKQICERIYKD